MGTTSAWRKLDPYRAAHLGRARDELEWAAQLAVALGASVLPKRDELASLSWSRAHEALVGRAIADGTRAALRPRELALLVISGDEVLAEQTLAGRTFAQALRWLASEVERRSEIAVQLAPPEHALPDHPVGRGEPFTADDGAGLAELADWYADAHHVLERVREQHGGSEIRAWPQRFGLATSIARGGRSIEVGMSAGDGIEPTPYFYASRSPRLDTRPELTPHARWDEDGCARLVGSALDRDAGAQRGQAIAFFDAAIAALDR